MREEDNVDASHLYPHQGGTCVEDDTAVAATATPTLEPVQETTIPLEMAPLEIMNVEDEIPMYLQEKQGSLCCACLCDYRRAVMWANSLFIGLATFLIMSKDTVVAYSSAYDDDAFADQVEVVVAEYYQNRVLSLGVALGTAILSSFGAATFRVWLVGLHALTLIADFVAFCFLALQLDDEMQALFQENAMVGASPVMSFVLNGVLMLLFLYPQVGFILECRLGIWTPETFLREDYSCCCRSKPRFLPTTTMPTRTAGNHPQLSEL